jgi:hypothetical protein
MARWKTFNETLKDILMTMVDEEGRDWDDHIPSTLMAFHSSIQESTQEIPYGMMFAEEMTIPLDLVIGSLMRL